MGIFILIVYIVQILLLSEALVIERPCCNIERHVAAKFGYFYPKAVTEVELIAAYPIDGCGPIRNDIAGKMALMIRGKCNFAQKVLQAQNSDAIAVVVMDNAHRVNNTWVVQMVGDAGNSSQITIPSVFVSHAIGLRLLDKIEAMKLAGMSVLVTLNATGQVTIKQKSSDIARQNIILVLMGVLTILLAQLLRYVT